MTDSRCWQPHNIGHIEISLAMLAGVAAMVARLPFILAGEQMLHSDEAIVGIMAQDILNGERFPVFFYGQAYMGTLEAYVIAVLQFIGCEALVALRLGPALFFCLTVIVAALVWMRWFGRYAGLLGTLSLIACSAFFVQWSIAARGAYVSVMLWGLLLWWGYFEWICVAQKPTRFKHFFGLGFLAGSGYWLNPSIVVFVAPVIVHALIRKPLRSWRVACPEFWRLCDCISVPIHLPCLGVLLLLALTAIRSTEVASGQITKTSLYGLLPDHIAKPVMLILVGLLLMYFAWRLQLREQIERQRNGVLGLSAGVMLGLLPPMSIHIVRVMRGTIEHATMPLGLRPVWSIGETIEYLWYGLPVVFGADPRVFLYLRFVGRQWPPVDEAELSSWLPIADATIVLVGVVVIVWFGFANRHAISEYLRLRDTRFDPAAFLFLACCGIVVLYVMSGFSFNMSSIRYLVPAWLMLSGVLAAAVHRGSALSMAAVVTLLLAWGYGQIDYHYATRGVHSHGAISALLEERGYQLVIAETLDAHYIAYLTEQRVKCAEYMPFWSRLGHYAPLLENATKFSYLVQRSEPVDWSRRWVEQGFPGEPPVETQLRLAKQVEAFVEANPEALLNKQKLVNGYELWTLARRLELGHD